MLELVAERGSRNAPRRWWQSVRASAGIIYHYFSGKDDLIRAVYLHLKAKMALSEIHALTSRFIGWR